MAGQHSYTITLGNNQTETQGIDFLLKADKRFLPLNKESRKVVMELLGLQKKFSRAFDLIMVPGQTNLQKELVLNAQSDITLIELKTTKQRCDLNPIGFFFGATKNEFDLAEQLGDKYRFCFVCLHPEKSSFAILSLAELQGKIRTKRIQYQINL